MSSFVLRRLGFMAGVAAAVSIASIHVSASQPSSPAAPAASASVFKLPMAFEQNKGQSPDQVQFQARGAGYGIFLTKDETLISLQNPATQRKPGEVPHQKEGMPALLRLKFLGMKPANAVGEEPLAARSNYFIGPREKWVTNVPTFGQVRAKDVYPGVSVLYYGNQRELEYDFEVAAGADAGQIAMAVEGADSLSLNEAGDTVLSIGDRSLRLKKPFAYQMEGTSQKEIACAYDLDGNELRFRLGAYDKSQPLVIDPILTYGSYLGGGGSDEAYGVAHDALGNIYICGRTTGSFPIVGGSYDTTFNGGADDAFICKINPTINGVLSLVYSTYLGAGGNDEAVKIAVDGSGNAYVTGDTNSGNSFPSSYKPVLTGTGNYDAFITKISANGQSLIYSAQLGGTSADYGADIAVDASGQAYITGLSYSSNFPRVNALDTTYGGSGDAILTKLNANGTALLFSTYYGGVTLDNGLGIAVDSSGRPAIVGFTGGGIPIDDAYQGVYAGGGSDAFVAKFTSTANAFVFSTYLGGGIGAVGGTAADVAFGVDMDDVGNVYVGGYTSSVDFPVERAKQALHQGGTYDAFLTKLRFDGSLLHFSTYLGGNGHDEIYGLDVDDAGDIYVTGETGSTNFPMFNAFDTSLSAGSDMFFTKYDGGGSQYIYSTYFGGGADDVGYDISADALGNAYVAGLTAGSSLTTTGNPNPLSANYGGGLADGFVMKLRPSALVQQVDSFETNEEAPPGTAPGWSRSGQSDPTLVQMTYDPVYGAYRTHVFTHPTKFRMGGWLANKAEWLPYTSIGTGNHVRAKFYMYATGQANPTQLGTIPNFRLRLANRFAVTAILEVTHHANNDPGNQTLMQEIRPSSDPENPSLYRMDFDPVDVPYLQTSTTGEGVMRGFEVLSLDPEDNGIIGMTESVISTYPTWKVPDTDPVARFYAPSFSDAGSLRVFDSATDLSITNLMLVGTEGDGAIVDNSTPKGTYSESAQGVTFDTTNVPTDRIGFVSREFFPGSSQASRVRVAEGAQYKVRFHVTSTQQSANNSWLSISARTGKFAYKQRIDFAGRFATGSGAHQAIATQTLPGIGNQNPDKIGAENGGWYTLIMPSPLNVDIRPEGAGPLATRMPVFTAEPGPGSTSVSRRDLRVGAELIDTLTFTPQKGQEVGNYTIDRIDVRVYELVDD